jgi:Fur family ferric uptake transcriptional regulator
MCGKVTEFKSQAIANAIDELKLNRFRKEGYSLYVYGICSVCQGKITRRKAIERKK